MDEKIEKIILTINKLNKKYDNIKLDIMGIERHKQLLDVFITIKINSAIYDTIIIENISENDYELEWIEYQIRNKIKNMLSDFYRVEL